MLARASHSYVWAVVPHEATYRLLPHKSPMCVWTITLTRTLTVLHSLQDVRDDALHLLDVLASRIWKDSLKSSKASAPGQAGLPIRRSSDVSHGPVAVVIGSLQDSYQQFQYQLSAKLARYNTHCFLHCACTGMVCLMARRFVWKDLL